MAKKKTSKKRKQKCHPENHSGDSSLDKWIDHTFDWCESWEWDCLGEDEAVHPNACDENGEPLSELCGAWRIQSIHHDGKDCWVYFVATEGDHLMELPLDMIPGFGDEEEAE